MEAAVDLNQVAPSHSQYDILSPIEVKVNQALQGTVPLDQTAADLTDPQRWAELGMGVMDYSYLLFSVLLSKTMAIPASSPYQATLMDLLRAIQQRPTPPEAEEEEPEIWARMPDFWMQVSEISNAKGLFEKENDSRPAKSQKMSVTQWANLHSFIANWYASIAASNPEDPSSGKYLKALQLFRHVLETPRSPQTVAQNLPAVAAWILSAAGPGLRRNCQMNRGLDSRDLTRPARWDGLGGSGEEEPELYTGPDSWNKDRWDFWVRRLRELQGQEELGLEACDAARLAVERMDTL